MWIVHRELEKYTIKLLLDIGGAAILLSFLTVILVAGLFVPQLSVLLWGSNPVICSIILDSLGSLREDLAVSMLRPGVEELHYLKASRGSKTPDFMILHRGKKIVFEVGGAKKGRKQFKGISADRKIILRDGGELSKESVPLHCLGFLAQFQDVVSNAEEALDDDYLSLVSRNLEEWERDED